MISPVVRLAAGDTAESEDFAAARAGDFAGFAPASINLAVLTLRRGLAAEASTILGTVAAERRDGNWRRVERMVADRGGESRNEDADK